MKKPLRQQNRQIISYVPRTEPAPPEHAIKMDSFRDVWMLRGKYVAFVLMGESFMRSPAFTVPESAQRWANQIRRELHGLKFCISLLHSFKPPVTKSCL